MLIDNAVLSTNEKFNLTNYKSSAIIFVSFNLPCAYCLARRQLCKSVMCFWPRPLIRDATLSNDTDMKRVRPIVFH